MREQVRERPMDFAHRTWRSCRSVDCVGGNAGRRPRRNIVSYRLSANTLATARAVSTEISTGTAQSICFVISNTITATDTVPVTPPDDN